LYILFIANITGNIRMQIIKLDPRHSQEK